MNLELAGLIDQARELSHAAYGKKLEIFVPGMFSAYGKRGRYPAVSLTGDRCELNCKHCAGRLLETMLPATSPEDLLALGLRLWEKGERGMLISGGSDAHGRLPLKKMIPAIRELSQRTGLYITAHVARIDRETAKGLKRAGVRQALVDVVGDAATAREVLNQPWGLAGQEETLDSLAAAGLEMVPHLIMGLHDGKMCGEEKALEIAAAAKPQRLVFLVFMPLKHTPMENIIPLALEEAALFMAKARLKLPHIRHHMGCARPRGRYRSDLDRLAVAMGVNALALPSQGALEMAAELGLEVSTHYTCCSLAGVDLPA